MRSKAGLNSKIKNRQSSSAVGMGQQPGWDNPWLKIFFTYALNSLAFFERFVVFVDFPGMKSESRDLADLADWGNLTGSPQGRGFISPI